MKSIIIAGIGEIGSVFARGFLRCGYRVIPVTRQHSFNELSDEELSNTELVLIAVGEEAMSDVIRQVPDVLRERICLLQNELLPDDWRSADILQPTVISVWFEKKKGMDSKVIIPSPVHGPHAAQLAKALATVDIPTRILDNEEQLLFELVLKNLYILSSNICGLRTAGNVASLWHDHQSLARSVAAEIIQLQQAMTGQLFNEERLLLALQSAFDGDPEHKCMGRSAPQRLRRALQHAHNYGLKLPVLEQLAHDHLT